MVRQEALAGLVHKAQPEALVSLVHRVPPEELVGLVPKEGLEARDLEVLWDSLDGLVNLVEMALLASLEDLAHLVSLAKLVGLVLKVHEVSPVGLVHRDDREILDRGAHKDHKGSRVSDQQQLHGKTPTTFLVLHAQCCSFPKNRNYCTNEAPDGLCIEDQTKMPKFHF